MKRAPCCITRRKFLPNHRGRIQKTIRAVTNRRSVSLDFPTGRWGTQSKQKVTVHTSVKKSEAYPAGRCVSVLVSVSSSHGCYPHCMSVCIVKAILELEDFNKVFQTYQQTMCYARIKVGKHNEWFKSTNFSLEGILKNIQANT